MLKERKPKFAKGQEAQSAFYFDILEGQGLDEGFRGCEEKEKKMARQNH